MTRRFDSGGEAGGGERQHVLKSLIGKDWSVLVLGVESNPLQLPSSATSAPEPLHDVYQ